MFFLIRFLAVLIVLVWFSGSVQSGWITAVCAPVIPHLAWLFSALLVSSLQVMTSPFIRRRPGWVTQLCQHWSNTGLQSIPAQSIQSVPSKIWTFMIWSPRQDKNHRSDENSSCRRLSGMWGCCDTPHFSDLWVPSGLVIFPHTQTPHTTTSSRMNIVCSYLYIFVTRELVSH